MECCEEADASGYLAELIVGEDEGTQRGNHSHGQAL